MQNASAQDIRHLETLNEFLADLPAKPREDNTTAMLNNLNVWLRAEEKVAV